MPTFGDRPPIAGSPLSVILLGESDPGDRDEVVAAWSKFLEEHKREHEILLVEPTHAHTTEALPRSAGPPHVRVVQVAETDPGSALRDALIVARHPLVFYTTANKDFQPNDLQLLLDRIDKVDVVAGYRVWRTRPMWLIWLDRIQRLVIRLLLGMSHEPRIAWAGWRGFWRRLAARWLFGVRVQDPECPFRLFRRDILARMPLQCAGPFVHAEFLAKANFLGCWMSEVPVTWLPTKATPPDPAEARRTRKEIIRLFRRPEFGAIPSSVLSA